MRRVEVIDTHTAGEPTRVVIEGGPLLGSGSILARLKTFRSKHDYFRAAVVNEPRGSDVMVGALLLGPEDQSCAAGVIFFNNIGYLGMCGHGLIGVVTALKYLGRIKAGTHRFETPVGVVTAELKRNGTVSFTNVPSYRKAKGMALEVPGIGTVHGDIAWGGNWFFLTEIPYDRLTFGRVVELTDYASRIRQAVNSSGFPKVDHVELFTSLPTPGAHSRNFVLCPGSAYDRSPCGTGTSAKLACLAADGQLSPNQGWIQEGIVGTTFTGWYRWEDQAKGRIIPVINGKAFVTAQSTLLLDERDPFCWGIAHASEVAVK